MNCCLYYQHVSGKIKILDVLLWLCVGALVLCVDVVDCDRDLPHWLFIPILLCILCDSGEANAPLLESTAAERVGNGPGGNGNRQIWS